MFSIKSRNLIWITALATLSLLASCETSSSKTRYIEAEKANLQDQLDEIARALATESSWLDETGLGKLRKESQLMLSDVRADLSTATYEGRTVDIVLEPYFRASQGLHKGLGEGGYWVALDPDEFYPQSNVEDLRETNQKLPAYHIPAYYHAVDGSVVESELTISSDQVYEEPVFFVSYETNAIGLAKAAACSENPILGTFLTFVGARLKTKKDDSNEEFELYSSSYGPDPLASPFQPTTWHEFNGANHLDASLRCRLYPNMELVQSMQLADEPIALTGIWLNGPIFRIVAIESDDKDTPRVYNRNDKNVGELSVIGVDYAVLPHPSNQAGLLLKTTNVSSAYKVGKRDPDNDDRYVGSGVGQITLNNIQTVLGAYLFYFETDWAAGNPSGLSDINWRLAIKSY